MKQPQILLKERKEVKKYNTNTDVFNDMGLGRVDAAVIGEMVGQYYKTTKPGDLK